MLVFESTGVDLEANVGANAEVADVVGAFWAVTAILDFEVETLSQVEGRSNCPDVTEVNSICALGGVVAELQRQTLDQTQSSIDVKDTLGGHERSTVFFAIDQRRAKCVLAVEDRFAVGA